MDIDLAWRYKTLCELPNGRMGPQIASRLRRYHRPSQRDSWFDPGGHSKYPDLVGQIFFATNDLDLDSHDKAVVDAALDYYRSYDANFYRHTMMVFKFIGNADHRGSVAYNEQLATKRANTVKRAFDIGFTGYLRYHSTSVSQGESKAKTQDLAGSRRVDIFSKAIPRERSIGFEAYQIRGKYIGPKTRKFKIRCLGGGGVSFGPLGGNIISFEIMNPNTDRSAIYRLTSISVGLSFGLNRPTSEWTEVDAKELLDVDDFKGNGRVVISVSGGVAGGQLLEFSGPVERGLTDKPVVIGTGGWDLNVGASSDIAGYWHRVGDD